METLEQTEQAGTEAADREPGRRGRAAVFLRVVVLLAIFFGLYVLSIGPVYSLMHRKVLGEEFVYLYTPLLDICDWLPGGSRLLEWYVGLWGVHPMY